MACVAMAAGFGIYFDTMFGCAANRGLDLRGCGGEGESDGGEVYAEVVGNYVLGEQGGAGRCLGNLGG